MALYEAATRAGDLRIGRKNEQDHVCVLDSVARSIIERWRSEHPYR